jgi:hypothetical protein
MPKLSGGTFNVTSYEVQYTVAENNPVNKVYATRKQQRWVIHIPINFPNVHRMGLEELLLAADASKLFRLSPDLNKKTEG